MSKSILDLTTKLFGAASALAANARELRGPQKKTFEIVQLLRECAAIASNTQMDLQQFIHDTMSEQDQGR